MFTFRLCRSSSEYLNSAELFKCALLPTRPKNTSKLPITKSFVGIALNNGGTSFNLVIKAVKWLPSDVFTLQQKCFSFNFQILDLYFRNYVKRLPLVHCQLNFRSSPRLKQRSYCQKNMFKSLMKLVCHYFQSLGNLMNVFESFRCWWSLLFVSEKAYNII